MVFLEPQTGAARSPWVAPRVDVPSQPLTVPDLPGALVPDVVSGPVPGWDGPPRNGLVTADSPGFGAEVLVAALVDEPPELLTAQPPRYPDRLRVAGIAGRVEVEAVIDTMGRAEPASLRVITSPHPGFDTAALAYVRGGLFRPGRVAGRAVRVLVRVPLEFRLTR